MTPKKDHTPGSAGVGEDDLRSSDLSGRKADEVKLHSKMVSEAKKPDTPPEASGEVAGALRG